MSEAPERYFYHSFPRRVRGTSTEIDVGCQILSMIHDYGLVMAPEVVKWQYEHADGSAPRVCEVYQRRVCFTEISPTELRAHADRFGNFALEFTVPTLRALGAIPVFYIPRAMSPASGAEGTGSTLVMQLADAAVLLQRIDALITQITARGPGGGEISCEFGFHQTGVKKFSVDTDEAKRTLEALLYSITPPALMSPSLGALQNYFYPADDTKHDEVLGYYREREWRIAGVTVVRGDEMMARPGKTVVEELLALDPEFYGREFPDGQGKNNAESCFLLWGLSGQRVATFINRVIVPECAVPRVQSIFKGVLAPQKIVSLESLTSTK